MYRSPRKREAGHLIVLVGRLGKAWARMAKSLNTSRPRTRERPEPELVEREALELFHPAVRLWFSDVFENPTRPQSLGWPAIARGDSTLILAPTGSGKTLAAFLWCVN